MIALLLAADAHAQTDLGEWEAYVGNLKRWVEREPTHPNHYLRVAQAYSSIGDTRQMSEYVRMARDRGAHPVQTYLLVGDHFMAMHRFTQAVDAFRQAWELAPRSSVAAVRLWRSMLELRKRGGALDNALAVAASRLEHAGYYLPITWRGGGPAPQADPARSAERTRIGYRALKTNDLPGAVRALRQALDADPTFADAFRGLAIAHARQKRLEAALACYTMFVELADPRHRDIPKIQRIILDFYRSKATRQ